MYYGTVELPFPWDDPACYQEAANRVWKTRVRGVERVHDPDTEWADAEIILDYNWSMAFINHNGQPYTEIVLYEGQ